MSEQTKPPTNSQIEKFRDAAKQLETNDDEGEFNEKLERVARHTPPKEKNGRDR